GAPAGSFGKSWRGAPEVKGASAGAAAAVGSGSAAAAPGPAALAGARNSAVVLLSGGTYPGSSPLNSSPSTSVGSWSPTTVEAVRFIPDAGAAVSRRGSTPGRGGPPGASAG